MTAEAVPKIPHDDRRVVGMLATPIIEMQGRQKSTLGVLWEKVKVIAPSAGVA